MTEDIVKALILATVLAAASIAAYRARFNARWRRPTAGAAVTVGAAAAFVACYFWLFERDECTGDSDFACIVNQNDGFLTLLAVVFAGAGLWTAALSRWADQRTAHLAELEDIRHVMQAATHEVVHNLMHVGSSLGPDGWDGYMPQLTVSAVPLLLDPAYRRHLDLAVLGHAEAITRNWEALQVVPPGWTGIEQPADQEGEPAPPEPPRLIPFISQSVGLLLAAMNEHPQWCAPEVFTEPRLQTLRDIVQDPRAIRWRTRSSDAHDDAADLHVNDEALACWWQDEDIPDLTIYALEPIFRDLAIGHRH